MRVVFGDEVDLPLPVPALELFLPQDRRIHLAEQFIVHEGVDAITRSEPRKGIVAVLPKARNEVRCNADVECSVRPARKDVDAGEPLFTHGSELEAQWVLKQVQDDDLVGRNA